MRRNTEFSLIGIIFSTKEAMVRNSKFYTKLVDIASFYIVQYVPEVLEHKTYMFPMCTCSVHNYHDNADVNIVNQNLQATCSVGLI